MTRGLAGVAALLAVLAWPRLADARTWQVGPEREYKQLSAVSEQLAPGDIVEVDGDATYTFVDFDVDATAAAPITVRGIAKNGKRPVVSGGQYTVMLRGNHYVFEGFEVTGGGDAENYVCVLHKANGIVVRDVIIHDCPNHGILGTDYESGSLTVEYSEIYNCGNTDRQHQIYVATDQVTFPGSVFRLQHSYIHDGNGGNNVKSRAERNEIYYNWIQGAAYHELDLIGAQEFPEATVREDSDVVGNVIIDENGFQIARIGGDGTGQTFGRYRFVNNTFVLAGGDLAMRAQDGLESIELSNNVILRPGGGAVRFLRVTEANWLGGDFTVYGVSNWFPTGSELPPGLDGTMFGSDAGFEDLATFDLRPADGSVLVDGAASLPPAFAGHELAGAEPIPLWLPPFGAKLAPGTAQHRPDSGNGIDVGAFELGSGPPLMPPGGDPPPDSGGGARGNGCACRAGTGGGSAARSLAAPLLMGVMLLLPRVRRRRR